MISCTTDELVPTRTTCPTSPALETTGMPTAMPTLEPLSIVIVHSKFETPFAITWAAVVSIRFPRLSCKPNSASSSASLAWSALPSASWVSSASTRSRRTSRS